MCASIDSVNQERDICRARRLQGSEVETDRMLGDNILQTVALTNEFRRVQAKIEENQDLLQKQLDENRDIFNKRLADNEKNVSAKLDALNQTILEERAERKGAMKVGKLLQWLLTGGGIAAAVKLMQAFS